MTSATEQPVRSLEDGESGLLTSELSTPSTLLGLAELAMEKTPESAWLAGESLLFVSLGDSGEGGLGAGSLLYGSMGGKVYPEKNLSCLVCVGLTFMGFFLLIYF